MVFNAILLGETTITLGFKLSSKRDTESFFSIADRVGTFLFANLIWCVMAMTIVGIPFATAGLFAMMITIVRGGQPEFFRIFGNTIRNDWQKIVQITLLDILVGGLLFINYSIFQIMTIDNFIAVLSGIMAICVTFVLIAINIYVWSLLTVLDISMRNMFRLSFILILTYPLTTLGITSLVLIPIIVSLFLPIAFFLFVTFSTSAFFGAKGTWFILNRHFSKTELDELIFQHHR